MRRTKIICTLGPATDSEEMVCRLIQNGMNVARLNFSHGSYEEHRRRIDMIKRVRDDLHAPVGILLDTKGPEVRIGDFANGKVLLSAGDTFTLTTQDVAGDETRVSINYKALSRDVKAGTRILIDDGLIELSVERKNDTEIVCRVLNGGVISNKKSINIPGVSLNIPFVSEKDRSDIEFGIEQDIDFIAASFTRSAADILEIKKILERHNATGIQIIAKIENGEGVRNVDEILKVCDGIMIARGDMGVEVPFEELPHIQKNLISKCYRSGKRAITATQMLDSMIKNPRPTRAETTDVANAVYDGTSAIMLSGETAMGKYPIESLITMSRIAERAEREVDYVEKLRLMMNFAIPSVTNAISHATCSTAHDLGAAAIINFTQSGRTARMISSFRPQCPIISCTPSKKVFHQLSISWGVVPVLGEQQSNTDDLFEHAVERAMSTGLVNHGDLVVITAGVPLGVTGTTNILKVHIVGNVLVRGKGVGMTSVSGHLCVCKTMKEAEENFRDGDILVVPKSSNRLLPILKRARAIVVEEEGVTTPAAIVGLTLDIPVLTGATGATGILKSGTTVTVDPTRGFVYSGITNAM